MWGAELFFNVFSIWFWLMIGGMVFACGFAAFFGPFRELPERLPPRGRKPSIAELFGWALFALFFFV